MRYFQHYFELINISLPVVATSIAIAVTNLITLSIVGNHSIEALAALSVFTTINLVVYNVFLASFSGYRILGSKAFGGKNLNQANSLFNNNMLITTVISFVIIIIISLYTEPIITLVTKDAAVINMSSSLLRISVWSYPFYSIMITLQSSLAIQKLTKINMYLIVSTNALGIMVNLILVYGIGFFKGIGVLGVAWGALFQSIIACILYLIVFPKATIRFLYEITFSSKECLKLWRLSYPSMVSMFIDYLSGFIMFAMISHFFGASMLASGRLGFTLYLLIFSIVVSISSGFNILGGRALGQGSTEKFINYYRCNRNLVVFCSILVSLPILIAPIAILGTFTRFDEIHELAYTPLIIIAIASPLTALAYNNAVYLRLVEEVKIETICNILALWCVQIPIAYCLGVALNWQLNGFFIAFLSYEIFYFMSTNYFVRQNINR